MTAKEKAKEIINKLELVEREMPYQDDINLFEAKQCAHIVCDEILETVMNQFAEMEGTCYGIDDYWEEVKQEIDKL